jgi:hypothetical protein
MISASIAQRKLSLLRLLSFLNKNNLTVESFISFVGGLVLKGHARADFDVIGSCYIQNHFDLGEHLGEGW